MLNRFTDQLEDLRLDISMLHVMEYNVACVLIFNRNE